MKIIFLVAIITIQLLALNCLTIFRDFEVAGKLLGTCLLAGVVILFVLNTTNKTIKDFGWGLFYGSLVSIVITFALLAWSS